MFINNNKRNGYLFQTACITIIIIIILEKCFIVAPNYLWQIVKSAKFVFFISSKLLCNFFILFLYHRKHKFTNH